MSCLPRIVANLLGMSATIAVLACGRSGLKVFEPEGDAGASGGTGGATTTTDSTTSSAGGGAGGSCPIELTLSNAASIGGADGFHQRQAKLGYSSDDRRRVTVASEWVAVEGPGQTPSELHHTSFEPWKSWPETHLEPSYLASPAGGVSFAVAPAAGDRFALTLSDGGDPEPPAGVALMRQLTPGSATVPPVQVVEGAGVDALALSMQVGAASVAYGAHLVAYTYGNPWVEARVRVASDSIGLTQPTLVGCGLERVEAAACSRSAAGWLLAVSTSPSGCAPSPAPATRVDFGVVDESGAFSPVASHDPGSIIAALDSAPRPEGAWIAWSTTGGLVQLTSIDAGGTPALAVLDLAVPDEPLVPDNLAVATFAAADHGALVVHGLEGPALRWTLVEGDGSICATNRIDGALPSDLIANPDGKGAVLATMRETPAGDRVELYRITLSTAK